MSVLVECGTNRVNYRSPNPWTESGRVPHVRPSVHGLKMTGRSPFHCFHSITRHLYAHTRLEISGHQATDFLAFWK
jgi:hypothetical protein